ncbi:D-lactaldehyde dehydrogenase [Coprinopsis sp. MPI-PUGE-AT-0042]|nr:D-lactaldehyde dehydrogenase [Coprinopsis sp. MPI-PUGE-AT-0042]
MPIIDSGAKVLVTGANGFIAMWVVRKLLEKGYSVRATVRSEEKGVYLTDYFKNYGDKIELAIVSDFSKDGAFDEAVKGVDAIVHTASPAHWKAKTPAEIIDPAVNGTLGVLKSAQKSGSNVKRIVISSSMASVAQTSDPAGTFYDHTKWNEESLRNVEELGEKAHPRDMYGASKLLAERAAWNFYEEHKHALSWDITVLNIPWPSIQEVSSPAGLNESMKIWWTVFVAPLPGSLDPKPLLTMKAPWADVRNIGDAHVLSLEKEGAGGERIIPTSGDFTWHEWVDAINTLKPSLLPGGKPVDPLSSEGGIIDRRSDVEKAKKILGINWITMEKSAEGIMENAIERGW